MTLTERRANPDITALLRRALTEQEMEKAKGGYWLAKGCEHNFVRTGRSREESFFIFWTHTVYEETCSKCNYTRWSY